MVSLLDLSFTWFIRVQVWYCINSKVNDTSRLTSSPFLNADLIWFRAIETISNWQLPTGGFGGGSDQLAHLATTYAAVNALAIAGTKEAYQVLNK